MPSDTGGSTRRGYRGIVTLLTSGEVTSKLHDWLWSVGDQDSPVKWLIFGLHGGVRQYRDARQRLEMKVMMKASVMSW